MFTNCSTDRVALLSVRNGIGQSLNYIVNDSSITSSVEMRSEFEILNVTGIFCEMVRLFTLYVGLKQYTVTDSHTDTIRSDATNNDL